MPADQMPPDRVLTGSVLHAARCQRSVGAALVALIQVGTSVPGEDNQTIVREERGEIASVFYDVRLDDDGAAAGCPPPWPEAILALGVERETWAWAASSLLLNAPGTPAHGAGASLVEERLVTSLRYTQSLWTPLPWDAAWEIDAALVERHADGPGAPGDARVRQAADPRVQLLLPLCQDRYGGILLGGGVSIPGGSDSDWFTTHRRTGVVAVARASWVMPGIPFLSAGAGLEVCAVPHAHQSIYTATPATAVTTNYDGVTGAGAVTYRWSRCLAGGIGLRGDCERFSGIRGHGVGAPVTEEMRACLPGAFVRIMMPACWFWHVDATRLAAGAASWRRCALGGGVSVVLW